MYVGDWCSWFLRCFFSCGCPIVIRSGSSRVSAGFCHVSAVWFSVSVLMSSESLALAFELFRPLLSFCCSSPTSLLFSSRLVFQVLRPSRRKVSALVDSLSS